MGLLSKSKPKTRRDRYGTPNPRRPEGRTVGFAPSDTHPDGNRASRRARRAKHTRRFTTADGQVVLLHATQTDRMVAVQLAREARARLKAKRARRRRLRESGRWA